jgi:hypothetical protein
MDEYIIMCSSNQVNNNLILFNHYRFPIIKLNQISYRKCKKLHFLTSKYKIIWMAFSKVVFYLFSVHTLSMIFYSKIWLSKIKHKWSNSIFFIIWCEIFIFIFNINFLNDYIKQKKVGSFLLSTPPHIWEVTKTNFDK